MGWGWWGGVGEWGGVSGVGSVGWGGREWSGVSGVGWVGVGSLCPVRPNSRARAQEGIFFLSQVQPHRRTWSLRAGTKEDGNGETV